MSDPAASVRGAALGIFWSCAWEVAAPFAYRALADAEPEVREIAAQRLTDVRADSSAP